MYKLTLSYYSSTHGWTDVYKDFDLTRLIVSGSKSDPDSLVRTGVLDVGFKTERMIMTIKTDPTQTTTKAPTITMYVAVHRCSQSVIFNVAPRELGVFARLSVELLHLWVLSFSFGCNTASTTCQISTRMASCIILAPRRVSCLRLTHSPRLKHSI